ncbi:MAG TPA: radical SAM protein [Gemmatimonadaceae bacterium]|nr:radical SAM protein [Gemmatimonadaceae bacterium]
MSFVQAPLFSDAYERASRQLPVLGEQRDIAYVGTRAKSVLNGPEVTGMGFWSINPYVGCAFGCTYCYARYAHRYVMERSVTADVLGDDVRQAAAAMPPWLAFERRIFVKQNAPEVLARTLRQGSDRHRGLVEGETVLVGTATDPYQPAERRYRVTRGILEVLAQHPGMDIVIITKSPLVTRDLDVLRRIARHSELSVHLSLITLDRALARRIEPRAPTPEARLRALVRLRESGIDAGINCMPVLPGITDDPRGLEALVKRAAEAGATFVNVSSLRLRKTAQQRYFPFIEREFPHLAAEYRRAYATTWNLSDRYRESLGKFFDKLCRKYGVETRMGRSEEDEGEAERTVEGLPAQLSLWEATRNKD